LRRGHDDVYGNAGHDGTGQCHGRRGNAGRIVSIRLLTVNAAFRCPASISYDTWPTRQTSSQASICKRGDEPFLLCIRQPSLKPQARRTRHENRNCWGGSRRRRMCNGDRHERLCQ
jgi:hypothetical protein